MYLLRQQNSALAPCTSATFIAPTVPLRQQNSALAPCTCYGSNTRPSRHSSPGPRPATILGARIVIDGITGKYTRAPTLYRIALMARPLIFSKWLTPSLPQAAVDRHLAHLGLYPRSDSAGLAPVAPPPPPTDGCCGPHHTLLRPRTVLCCGPCSLTVVHFRGPRPCSSAPPPTDGCCGPHHTLLRSRTVLCCGPAPLQYTSAGLAFVAQPPPTDGCCGPHHTLLRSLTVLCCTAAPGSGHFGGFHRPHCVAAAANASPCHGQSRDLCRPCCTAAPGSGHLAFSRPPPSPLWHSLSLRLTLAVSTPVVPFRSTHHSVCIVEVCV